MPITGYSSYGDKLRSPTVPEYGNLIHRGDSVDAYIELWRAVDGKKTKFTKIYQSKGEIGVDSSVRTSC